MKKITVKTVVSLILIIVVLVGIGIGCRFLNQKIVSDTYPLKYETEITAAADKYHVDKALIFGVIKTESDFNPQAVSRAGAVGLMQIMPDTFEWMQTYYKEESSHTMEDLRDPAVNIDYGVELLSILLEKYGDEETALCAYNGGVGHVDEGLKDPQYSDDGKTLKAVPFNETNNYRRLVEQHKSIYNKLYFSGDSSAVK